MEEIKHSLSGFLLNIMGFGFLMSYAKWLLSNKPHEFRIIVGDGIINAFCGASSLSMVIVKPDIPDYGLYGIAFIILLFGPAAFKLAIMKIFNKKFT